jgi:hypothetical protein
MGLEMEPGYKGRAPQEDEIMKDRGWRSLLGLSDWLVL